MPGKDRDKEPGVPGLGPEDRALWRRVTRDAEPLKRRAPPAPKAAPPLPPEPKAPGKPAPRPTIAAAPARPRAPTELGRGDIVGLDKRSAERLRRGRMDIDATLDLHGHTQAAAHRELDAFLAAAQAAGKRCVLIVTGKGTTKEAGGVLRAQVPRWLNQAPNRARVLAFDYAQPRDGGMGALYVLLRKKRNER